MEKASIKTPAPQWKKKSIAGPDYDSCSNMGAEYPAQQNVTVPQKKIEADLSYDTSYIDSLICVCS